MVNVKLYSYSTMNKITGYSDTETILNHPSTELDAIVEYAARVCYKSTDRMGTSPNFIQKRIEERHEDVVEHGYVTFMFYDNRNRNLLFDTFDEYQYWYQYSRFINVELVYTGDGHAILMGANLRTWLQIARHIMDGTNDCSNDWYRMVEMLAYLNYLAPQVFSEFSEHTDSIVTFDMPPHNIPTHYSSSSPGTVTLLSATQGEGIIDFDTMVHATFLIEHVSRSLTHQLVRYRLLSFSQESQRYVDLEKGGWDIVVPTSFEYETEQFMKLNWENTQDTYRSLRALGARKEDARFILPNATETRLVVSGTLEGWRNAIWQRCAKSAQWEIRGIFIEILKILYELYPTYFQKEYDEFIKE